MSASAVSLDLSVACTGFTDTAQGHTVYNLSCRASVEGATVKKTFTVDRRFSEFEELHKALQPLIPSIPTAFPVAKTMMTTESTKRERVDKFQDYLRGAVSAAGPSPPGLLLKFLAVDVSKLQQARRSPAHPRVAHAPPPPRMQALTVVAHAPVRRRLRPRPMPMPRARSVD